MDDVRGADVLAELRELRQRVAELEAKTESAAPAEERSTRRGMLRLAGAAVVGGAAASLVGAQPVSAAPEMQLSELNDAGVGKTSIVATNTTEVLELINTGGGTGVKGIAPGNGEGVWGRVEDPLANGFGVLGQAAGTQGYGVMASGGASQLLLDRSAGGMPINVGFHHEGALTANEDGLFYCVAEGTPGTWRKLAGLASSGVFHAVTPTRVYDSRWPMPAPGPLFSGENRTIIVADGCDTNGLVITPDLVPEGATSVAANVTITGTTGGFGYLAINPGGNFVEGASTINWSSPGLTIANGVILTLDSLRRLTVICNGGGSTHFIVDIAGYFL